MNSKPLVAITMGDPSGVGAEVIIKSIAALKAADWFSFVVIGDTEILKTTNILLKTELQIESVGDLSEIPQFIGRVPVLDTGNFDPRLAAVGQLSAEAGRASMEWVLKSGQLCLSGAVDAIATAPINKEACRMAGYEDIGHMEVYQRLSRSKNVATMLVSGHLRVVHLTTHRSLRLACDYVTKDHVFEKIILTDTFFRDWGFPEPRIAVAALNPHASDGGLIGHEENQEIAPAVDEARRYGARVDGPIPADTVFHQAIRGNYDVVIAMYHDQGHIPIKVYGFEESISVNLGLPFVRTSVDHGTAFDIAGKGVADPRSMIEAIGLAAALSSGRGLIGTGLSSETVTTDTLS